MDWQQLATPPEILGNALWEAIGWVQADWYCGIISYSEFLCNLDEIFECLEDL